MEIYLTPFLPDLIHYRLASRSVKLICAIIRANLIHHKWGGNFKVSNEKGKDELKGKSFVVN